MRLRDALFGGTDTESPPGDAGMMVLRVFAGLALALAHGRGKVPPSPGFVEGVGGMGLPLPELFAWLAAFAEFGCGILLAIGLLTRPAAFVLVGNFVIIVLLAHAGDDFMTREKPLLFLAIAFAFLLRGAGRFSVDALIRGRRDPHTLRRR